MNEEMVKNLTKWLTFALVVSLVAFPVISEGLMTYTPAGLVVTGMFWLLFNSPDLPWLWLIMMFAAPVAMYMFKEKNDQQSFIIKASCTFASFLGSLLMIVVGGGTGFGTWICMFISAALCGIITANGLMKMNNK